MIVVNDLRIAFYTYLIYNNKKSFLVPSSLRKTAVGYSFRMQYWYGKHGTIVSGAASLLCEAYI